MNILLEFDSFVCSAICLRLIFFRRDGATYRPLAGAIAYIIIIAAATVPLRALLGTAPAPGYADIVLHLVLALAIFAARGNIVELFHTSAAENCIHRFIRRDHRHAHE